MGGEGGEGKWGRRIVGREEGMEWGGRGRDNLLHEIEGVDDPECKPLRRDIAT